MLPLHSGQRLFRCAVLLTLFIMISAAGTGCGSGQDSSDVTASDERTLGIFTSSLFGLDFIDKNKGWAVGKLGGIIHTEDGGQNWWAQESDIDFHLYDVKFVDAKNGWAVGDMGSIIHTSDSGKNWEIIRHEVKWIWFLPRISYVFRADYQINRRIDFVKIKGDLREMKGSWHLFPLDEADQTIVRYEVYLDPSFFIPQWFIAIYREKTNI